MQPVEESFRFLDCMAPPLSVQLVPIPVHRQFPCSLGIQDGAARQIPSRGPPIDVFFRPEDQDGASGIADVRPPFARRNCEVDQAFGPRELAIRDVQLQELAAIAAWGDHCGILRAQRRDDSQRVPRTDPPITLALDFNAKSRRDRAERIRGPDVPVVRRQDEGLGRGQALQSSEGC